MAGSGVRGTANDRTSPGLVRWEVDRTAVRQHYVNLGLLADHVTDGQMAPRAPPSLNA